MLGRGKFRDSFLGRDTISQRQVQGAVSDWQDFLRREPPSLLALEVISQGEMSK